MSHGHLVCMLRHMHTACSAMARASKPRSCSALLERVLLHSVCHHIAQDAYALLGALHFAWANLCAHIFRLPESNLTQMYSSLINQYCKWPRSLYPGSLLLIECFLVISATLGQ